MGAAQNMLTEELDLKKKESIVEEPKKGQLEDVEQNSWGGNVTLVNHDQGNKSLNNKVCRTEMKELQKDETEKNGQKEEKPDECASSKKTQGDEEGNTDTEVIDVWTGIRTRRASARENQGRMEDNMNNSTYDPTPYTENQ